MNGQPRILICALWDGKPRLDSVERRCSFCPRSIAVSPETADAAARDGFTIACEVCFGEDAQAQAQCAWVGTKRLPLAEAERVLTKMLTPHNGEDA